MVLLLTILIVPSLGCKPTLSTVLADLLPSELTKLLHIPTPSPQLPVLDKVKEPEILSEIEGSGVESVRARSVPMTCADTAMVELQTTHPWSSKKLMEYGTQFERDFRRLQRYSKTPVESFGGEMTRNVIKIHTSNGSVYGQKFFVEGITVGCSVISDFVRKAVSWSSTIPKATLSCRCEQDLVIQKV